MQKAETAITKRPVKAGECRECDKLREHRFRLLTVIAGLTKERDDAKRLLDATLAEKRQAAGWQWWEWALLIASVMSWGWLVFQV